MKILAAIMLMTTMLFTVGCKKDKVEESDGGGYGSYNGHPYVDLDLPSGLLWATCNVGADNPEGYGDYFAWGETQPKDEYGDNYKYYKYSSDGGWLTKYCINSDWGYNGYTDGLTTLLPIDDAATANWGDGWRMPTKDDFLELYNHTSTTWTTKNGVNGLLFIASNGNSLFLPAAGYRSGIDLIDATCKGDYWSSSLDTGFSYFGRDLYFGSDNCSVSGFGRSLGVSVRPVRSKYNHSPK